MKNIVIDYSNSSISNEEIQHSKWQLEGAHKILHERTGSGNDFLGWIDLQWTMTRKNLIVLKKQPKSSRKF